MPTAGVGHARWLLVLRRLSCALHMHMRTSMHRHARKRTSMHARTSTRVHAHMYARPHAHTPRTHTRTHARMHACIAARKSSRPRLHNQQSLRRTPQVVEFLHVKPGKGAAFVRSKVSNPHKLMCACAGSTDVQQVASGLPTT